MSPGGLGPYHPTHTYINSHLYICKHFELGRMISHFTDNYPLLLIQDYLTRDGENIFSPNWGWMYTQGALERHTTYSYNDTADP